MKVSDEFGTFCAEGQQAVNYLQEKVYPELDCGRAVTLDFDGVKNINSSFANALFANLVRRLDGNIKGRIEISNARENVQIAIKMGLHLGMASLKKV